MNAARQLSSPTAVAATAASSNDKLLDDVFSDVGVQLQALTSAAGGAAMATATTVGTAGGAGAEDFPLLVPTAGPHHAPRRSEPSRTPPRRSAPRPPRLVHCPFPEHQQRVLLVVVAGVVVVLVVVVVAVAAVG